MKAASAKKKSADRAEVSEPSFPVVAIGASAGGLEAMIELLKHLPADTGMAFIYVQHLSPDHKSMLTEILSKRTTMPLHEIDDMDKIKPNNVFVIPENRGIEVTDGHIKLIPRSDSAKAITIDVLFSSLAQAQKERVIGIVLSGSGSDGTTGIQDIKQEGGLTFAQDDTAKFNSMPHAAIATGMIDFVLSPKEIALELSRLSKHQHISTKGVKHGEEDAIDNNSPALKSILHQLHKAVGVDFSVYKMNTIKRRIIRRMLLYRIPQLNEYAKLLSTNKEEVDILYQDLLINVTRFFRDTDTHKYLKDHLFPKLLSGKKPGEPLRIWVPACATGEEAYSLAMMLLEIQERKATDTPVQIFATDLSEQAIHKARTGTYTRQEMETVSPKRLQRFFNKSNDGFRVNKNVRDLCVFATHNILQDPPFSRLDFISCCNLFIYLDVPAQKKAVHTFHYALNDGGFLMLGQSENITQSAHLFKSSIEKYKIFSRKNSNARSLPQLSQRSVKQNSTGNSIPETHQNQMKQSPVAHRTVTHNGLDDAIDAVLVAEFMPASVVINHQLEIIQFRGTTDLFLTHPKGKATFNILKMARPELAFALRNTISKVIKTKQRIRKSGIELKVNATVRMISLEIVPLEIQSDEDLLLILFTEQEQTEVFVNHGSDGKTDSIAKDRRIKKLEEELAAAYADAVAIAQEHEAFTEEMQSASEEVVSSNEELQTLNEELETSKEELESANEELTTTNQELQTRNDLLNESYDYSEALLSTLHEPLIVLDRNLRVKSATKNFYKKFKVKAEETEGALLYDLGNKQWNIPRLRELLEDILPKNKHFHDFEIAHDFPSIGEKIMMLNASRIVQKANQEELILLAISDITDVRKFSLASANAENTLLHEKIAAQQKLKEVLDKAQKQLQNIFLNAPAATAVLEGPDHIYMLSNTAYQKLFNRKTEDFLGRSMREVFPELAGSGLFELVHQVYETGESFTTPEYAMLVDDRNDGVPRQQFYHFSLEPLKNTSGEIYAVIAMIYDITERVVLRKKIEESEKQKLFQLKLNAALSPLTNPVDIEQTVTEIALDFMEADWCHYSTIEDDHLIIHRDAVRGDLPSLAGVYPVNSFSLFKAVLHSGHPLVVDDVRTTDRLDEELKQRCMQLQQVSFILVPVVKSGKHVGLLSLVQSTPRKWTEAEVDLNIDTAERTWAAVQRAKAEEALGKSEEKYRNLFTSIDQGFTLCELIRDQEGKAVNFSILDVNPTYEQQTGVNKEMVLGKPLLEVFPSLNTLLETYAAVVDDQRPAAFENYFEDKARWFAVNAYPVEKDRFAVLFSDITERKEAEEKINASEKNFRQLAELLPQKITQADPTGKVLFYNQNWQSYSGISTETLLREGWGMIMHPDERDEISKQWLHSTKTGNDFQMEIRLLNKKGEYNWHLSHAIAIKDDKGNILKWIGAATEIQKQVEQRIELENAVERRTIQLKQSNDDLLRINKELEAFTYVSSHDLQEPLRKIQIFAGRILEKENQNLSDTGKSYFRLMQNESQRMKTLIQDLLLFSKLNIADRKFEPTDLNSIIDEVKNEFAETIAEKHAVIEVKTSCDIYTIPFQFRQLMHNLISNALKFSNPEIPPHIVVHSRKVKYNDLNIANLPPHEAYCHISIADNGIGFEKEYSKKIFEVFQKLHGKDEYSGTGIGLAIVKKIVDNHNGIITATSKLNKGTTFNVYIPVALKKQP
jgi:two-component system CheB/CheR fusion protein